MLTPLSIEILIPNPVMPISLTEAKSHLRVDHTDDDVLITGIIASANDYVMTYTGRSLMPRTLKARYETFDDLVLPHAPVIEIESVTYNDGTVLSTTVYDLVKSEPAIMLLAQNESWPTAEINSVYVQYRAGYEDSSDSPIDLTDRIPPSLKAALLLVIGDLYQNREARALVNGARYEANPTVKALMNPYRVILGI